MRAREAQVLELRKAGVPFRQIAEQVGYAGPGPAYEAYKRAMHAIIKEPAEAVRDLEVARLDALFTVAYQRAAIGDRDLRALDRCLSIMDRRAKLLGLDAPSRRVVDVITHDEFSDALSQMEREVRQMEAELSEEELAALDGQAHRAYPTPP